MKLRDVTILLPDDMQIRIGAKEGQKWILANVTVKEFKESEEYKLYGDRVIVNSYHDDGREANNRACALNPATCIEFQGTERGTY